MQSNPGGPLSSAILPPAAAMSPALVTNQFMESTTLAIDLDDPTLVESIVDSFRQPASKHASVDKTVVPKSSDILVFDKSYLQVDDSSTAGSLTTPSKNNAAVKKESSIAIKLNHKSPRSNFKVLEPLFTSLGL